MIIYYFFMLYNLIKYRKKYNCITYIYYIDTKELIIKNYDILK